MFNSAAFVTPATISGGGVGLTGYVLKCLKLVASIHKSESTAEDSYTAFQSH